MNRIGIIAIIIEENRESVTQVNAILSEYSEPVSYTHLDVYKRQHQAGAPQQEKKGPEPGDDENESGPTA